MFNNLNLLQALVDNDDWLRTSLKYFVKLTFGVMRQKAKLNMKNSNGSAEH